VYRSVKLPAKVDKMLPLNHTSEQVTSHSTTLGAAAPAAYSEYALKLPRYAIAVSVSLRVAVLAKSAAIVRRSELSSKISVPYSSRGYSDGALVPNATEYPVGQSSGFSRASISYERPNWMENLEKATEAVVATSGLTPAIPATIQYVLVKSNFGESARAMIEAAALISVSSALQPGQVEALDLPASPTTIWQTSPSSVQ
jgi:hypothetical protein